MAFGQSWEGNWLFLQSILDICRMEISSSKFSDMMSSLPGWDGSDHVPQQSLVGLWSWAMFFGHPSPQLENDISQFAFCVIPGSPRVRGDGLGRKDGEESANSSLHAFHHLWATFQRFHALTPHTEVCQSDMRGVARWSRQEEDLLI